MRRSSQWWIWMCAVWGLFLLGGCASSPDPREGGFFGGIHGLSSGKYEQRVKERDERLKRMRALQEEMRTEGRELELTKAELEQAFRDEQQALADLDRDIGAMEDNLAALAAGDEQQAKQIEEIRRRLQILKGKGASEAQKFTLDDLEGTHGHDEARLRLLQLTEQRDALRREYDLLLDLSLDLAR